ncbi:hypothetical protein V1525DRAFT_422965, partial [Lipomyces kononenkoae]
LRATQANRGICITTDVYVNTTEGRIRALLDGGAESNFMSRTWAKTHSCKLVGSAVLAEAVDGHLIPTYGKCLLDLVTPDSGGRLGTTLQAYNLVDMPKYDFILGMPWHETVEPDMRWAAKKWYYRDGNRPDDINPKLQYYRTRHGAVQRFTAQHAPSSGKKRKGRKRRKTSAEVEANEPMGDPHLHSISRITAQEVADEARKGNPVFVAHIENKELGTVSGLHAVSLAELPAYVQEYSDVFSEEQAAKLPDYASHDHAIDIEPGKEPPYRSIYRLSPKEQEVLREYLVTNLAK